MKKKNYEKPAIRTAVLTHLSQMLMISDPDDPNNVKVPFDDEIVNEGFAD